MAIKSDALLYKIALTRIPNVGSVLAKNLISFCGGPEPVFQQNKSSLLKIPGIGHTIADCIVNKKTFAEAENEIQFIERYKIKPLFFLDNEYPIRLKQVRDAPILLYFKGNADLNNTHVVGVVGTRKSTPFGRILCEKLVEDLRPWNVLVVSGLAYGIDITAHRKAIESQLPTVGVLGSGLDRLYPAAHRQIAQTMVASHGGLITEFGSGTKPDREHFPMRNRIIAGMVDALVVVESDVKGGAMITAELANGYYRDVFAIPGRVGDQYSSGCNFLIKTSRAQLLENGKDLAQSMGWKTKQQETFTQQTLFHDLSDEEKQICKILDKQTPVNIDKVYKESTLPISDVMTILLGLELKNMVKVLPGKMYILL